VLSADAPPPRRFRPDARSLGRSRDVRAPDRIVRRGAGLSARDLVDGRARSRVTRARPMSSRACVSHRSTPAGRHRRRGAVAVDPTTSASSPRPTPPVFRGPSGARDVVELELGAGERRKLRPELPKRGDGRGTD